jgi:hypothetical protein
MRAVAADLRRDALAGMSAAERERFVNALLAIKSNLQRLQAVSGNVAPALRRRAR